MIIDVYDLECLKNLFTFTSLNRDTKEFHQFVIHESRNDYIKLVNYLRSDKMVQIGFSNVNYDYPLLHHLLNHYKEYIHYNGDTLSGLLYKKSQEIINMEFSAISPENEKIPQIDVFKINNWDSPARSCSLKQCEVAMKMDLVEDMPLPHDYVVTTEEEINMILEYNKHDVVATNMVFDVTLGRTEHLAYKNKNKVQIRQKLSKKYGINLMNLSDVKIGETLLLEEYCKATGLNKKFVSKNNTKRESINLRECIPDYIKFKSKKFNNLMNSWRNTTIKSTKGAISVNIPYHGILLGYGTGGMHASNSGVFNADDYYTIIDSDVSSLYPSIAVKNKYRPEHLLPEFNNVYDKFVDIRLKEKDKAKELRDMVIVEGYKFFINGAYGKSNEPSSFLFDSLYTMKTTITGQLSLTMLIESLSMKIPEIQWIQVNTDGITALVPKKYTAQYYEVCKKWEYLTQLVLVSTEFKKMVVRDVSNYMAIYNNGEIKSKGCFEIYQEFYKNPSMRIVPIALKEYYENNIPVEQTIKNHKDILDFCLMIKGTKSWASKYKYIDSNGNIKIKDLTKITRYYISGGSGSLYRENTLDKNQVGVNVGYGVKIFNKKEDKCMKDYDINYSYYVRECNKIIMSVDSGQLRLF